MTQETEGQAKDHVVATFWLPEGADVKKAIMHVYGPYTKAQARKEKAGLDATAAEEDLPGLRYAKVCKVLDPESWGTDDYNDNEKES